MSPRSWKTPGEPRRRRTSTVWSAGSPGAAHAVDVTDTFDAGVDSLKEHQAYIEGLGWEGWDPAEFLEGILRGGGQGQ